MRTHRIAVSTDGSGDFSTTFAVSGHLLYGWYVDINGLATSTTTDITLTDDTGRTLDSATNVTVDGMYLPRESDTGGDSQTDYPPIAGSLTVTVDQGGATITDGVIWVWTLD